MAGAHEPTADRYDPIEVETRWRARWEREPLPSVDLDHAEPAVKFYNLVEFPYPSAEGLHVGHVYTYCGADTFGRYMRMRGRHVFQPMGFDSFGIHTENYALKVGENPRALTERTVANYRSLLGRLGAAWDWDHEVVTSDPSYYRWTQWVFLQLFRAGLAVREEAPVVWCPSCLTVLAHEQVEGDRCERCDTRVTERLMLQWFLRITAYAEQLLDRLDVLDWPEAAKRGQREWIGRSRGMEIDFAVEGSPDPLTVFTTRPDTLYGATYLAVSPTHPLVEASAAGDGPGASVRDWLGSPEAERTPGVAIGAFARGPFGGEPLPIFAAGYVVAAYGTGAVMGVPAHDERDLVFARGMGLPVAPASGQPSAASPEAIADRLEEAGLGRRATRYRLHDWLISRQRYWGPPIPIVHCDACGIVPVPEEDLPVLLPDVEDVRPTGSGLSPLAAVESFVSTTCPTCGGPARRETDVSDTFLDSAWYFLRFPSSDVSDRPWDQERTARMLPVDQYAGGKEHVMRHHLYARFVTAALHDLGHVPIAEPFPRLRLHGLLIKDGAKMSKSRGNVVDPDDYLRTVGADALRASLLFCGPWEEGGDFSDRALQGVVRFTRRAWRLIADDHPSGPGGVDLRPVDRAVAAVGRDIERLKFNTAISVLMDLARWARANRAAMSADEWSRTARAFVLLLAPFAPHLAEELWARLGGGYSVHAEAWPSFDRSAVQDDEVTLVVQVNGRVRDRLVVRRGLDRDAAIEAAMTSERIRSLLEGGPPLRVVHVPDRLVNLIP